jgi:hypothetical protein
MARGKLGRPPLPDDERKRTITVYLGTRTVEHIEEQAARTGLSRNHLIATVLADHFDGQGTTGAWQSPEPQSTVAGRLGRRDGSGAWEE